MNGNPAESTGSGSRWHAGDEPIAGYRLLEPLGKGGFGEVWKCEAPGGFAKAIKFVSGGDSALSNSGLASQEQQALEFMKNIRHPFVLTVERVEVSEGTLLIVMELADKSLGDLFKTYHESGQPGIPRVELLGYLDEAAEALDLMNFEHGLQHLDIKPQNLFLVSNQVKVADFGLVNRLPQRPVSGAKISISSAPRGITPRYVAPEVLNQKISRRSDQYSLAIVYQELLTGAAPFNGRNGRQLIMQHLQAQPDVSPLAAGDRSLVLRALSKDPEERFASCRDFVRALIRVIPRPPSAPGWTAPKTAKAETASVGLPKVEKASGDLTQVKTDPALQYDGFYTRTALGEIWKARLATGEEKMVYHLTGFAVDDQAEQRKALSYLQGLRHRSLPRFAVQELDTHRMVLLFDPWGPSLQEQGRSLKLPVEELLEQLAEAAHALDDLAAQANLFHLALTPEGILRGLDGVLLRDFGLVPLLWSNAQAPLHHLNARYGAPELARGKPHATSDQYSLALIYADMRSRALTGAERVQRGASRAIDLEAMRLPPAERRVLAQALDPDPARRFDGCVTLVERLAETIGGTATSTTTNVRNAMSATQEGFLATLEQWLQKDRQPSPRDGSVLTLADGSMSHTCLVEIVPATAALRLDVFAQEFRAQRTLKKEAEFRYFIALERTFWQRLRGREVGIEVRVALNPVSPDHRKLFEAAFDLRPVNCGADFLKRFHEELGPALVKSLRASLNAQADRRGEERVSFEREVTIRHRPPGHPPTEYHCKATNLSSGGIGFITEAPLSRDEVRVLLSLPGEKEGVPVLLKAVVCRCRALPDGRYEIGAEFVREKKEA